DASDITPGRNCVGASGHLPPRVFAPRPPRLARRRLELLQLQRHLGTTRLHHLLDQADAGGIPARDAEVLIIRLVDGMYPHGLVLSRRYGTVRLVLRHAA